MNPSDASGHDSTECIDSGASSSKAPPNAVYVYAADQEHLRSGRCAAEDRCAAAGGAFDEIDQRPIRLATLRWGLYPDSDRISVDAFDLRSRSPGYDVYA